MKKLALFVLCSSIGFISLGQNLAQPVLDRYFTPKPLQANPSLLVFDTLDQYMQRATNFALYLDPYGGYVYGTGMINVGNGPEPMSEETGCHYDAVGNAVVVEVFCFAARKNIVGTADSLYFKVYEVNSDTIPTAMTGSSAISITDFDTTGLASAVLMNAPVSTSFIVALSYAGIDDTIGLVSSNLATHDGNGENRARYKLTPAIAALAGSTYMAVNVMWQGQVDCDVIMVPIVDIQTGMSEFRNDLFTLQPLSPNPSNGKVVLAYNLLHAAEVAYAVMDASGRLVMQSDKTEKSPAGYSEVIDMTSLSSGKYYVSFRAGKKVLTQRMMLIR